MTDTGISQDFYEEDEPLEDVLAAFDRGQQGVTRPPVIVETCGLAAPEASTFSRQVGVSLGSAAQREGRP